MTEVESNATWWSLIFGRGGESFVVKSFTDDDGVPSVEITHYGTSEKGKNIKQSVRSADIPQPWFQEQFMHKTSHQLVVTKTPDPEKILAITGATISTKAAINAVQNALEKVTHGIQPRAWEIK